MMVSSGSSGKMKIDENGDLNFATAAILSIDSSDCVGATRFPIFPPVYLHRGGALLVGASDSTETFEACC